ncbi:MAG: trypsin-like peptidase domain-containing protein [Bryobacterales bacterium]|nr:trypsin-like peptidase domain-containing protein [Bryobacterales bacterium]
MEEQLMQQRIVLRHLSAGKANQVEEFPVVNLRELVIGRDPSCAVRYEADSEDLVGRHHAKILIDSTAPLICSVMDLNSRSGTFLSKQRIFSAVRLLPGDVVQLGPGGPEFQFDIDPRPPGARPTRIAAAPLPPDSAAPAAAEGGLADPGRSRTRKFLIIAAILALAALVAAAAFWNARTEKLRRAALAGKSSPIPVEIAKANFNSVVFLEAGWKLFDTESGRPLSQVYQVNATANRKKWIVPIDKDAGGYLPVFVRLPGESNIEPMLSTEDGQGTYKAIAGAHTGSGFVVGADGYVLTSRRVAAAWDARYNFPGGERTGVVYLLDEKMEVKGRAIVSASQFPAWAPAAAKFVLQGAFEPGAVRMPARPSNRKLVEGRNDYLDVTFVKNRIRIPAKPARVSDRIDVALVKIEIPGPLREVKLNGNHDTIKPGDAVLVMGYPAISPDAAAVTRSKNALNPDLAAKGLPDPTVSLGQVGRIVRGPEGAGETPGEVYQLTVNSTGSGNSGGPVLDGQGRVIAIYTAGRPMPGDAAVSLAVPIRYGIELMGAGKVMK